MNRNEPEIVYHYCSLESFLAIIENSTIRLTNIVKSNDKDEVRYCFDIFERVLRKSCKDFAFKVDNEKLKEFLLGINFSDLVSRAVLNESLLYYVACFSEKSDLLSQWRGYANDGKGVAIGFYSKAFMNAQDLKNLKFSKINYDIKSTESLLYNSIINKLLFIYHNNPNVNDLTFYEAKINDFINTMVYNAVFFKNPAFQEECEWRFVFYPFGNIRNLLINHKYGDMASNQLFYDRMYESIEYDKYYNGLNREKLRFKCTDDKIISYINMNFDDIKNSVLAEIVIGPKSDIDDKDLRLFLMSNEYDLSKIHIKKSLATYR